MIQANLPWEENSDAVTKGETVKKSYHHSKEPKKTQVTGTVRREKGSRRQRLTAERMSERGAVTARKEKTAGTFAARKSLRKKKDSYPSEVLVLSCAKKNQGLRKKKSRSDALAAVKEEIGKGSGELTTREGRS